VTVHTLQFTGWAALAAALWLAMYRLPLRTPRMRQRFRLTVSSWTGLAPRLVFPIVGTVIYLVAGALTTGGLTTRSPVSWYAPLLWRPSLTGAALTALAVVGASSLTAFAMSMLYATRPGVDVAGAMSTVRWIQEVLVLPPKWRWVVPMSSAALEEYCFRGVVLTGLVGTGAPAWLAIAVSGTLFTVGQVILTENRLQAFVLAMSSVVLSVVGGLLVIVEGSVLPAIVVHASFAGYYTNLPVNRDASTDPRASRAHL
jgi:hypothetical protein